MPHLEGGGERRERARRSGRAKRATSSRNFNIDRSKMPTQRPRGPTRSRGPRAARRRRASPGGVPKRARSRTIRTSCPRRTKHSSCGSRSRLFVGGGSAGVGWMRGGASVLALFFFRSNRATRRARAATRRDARSRAAIEPRGARIDGRTSARAHLERRRRRARGPRGAARNRCIVTFAANRAMTHGEAARGERRSNARDALDVRDVGVPAARKQLRFHCLRDRRRAFDDERARRLARKWRRARGLRGFERRKKGPDWHLTNCPSTSRISTFQRFTV